MINKNQRCKMSALFKSLKIYMCLYFGFTFQNPSSRVRNILTTCFIATYIQLKFIGIGTAKERN